MKLTYMDFVHDAALHSLPTPVPSTRDELAELADAYPERARPFLPAKAERDRIGINVDPPQPFSPEFRGRFVATLAADPEFRSAVQAWLGGAV